MDQATNDGTEMRGGDRSGARQYNERLIMQVIRRAGGLPKADVARSTGLSPQTVSVIVNRLLDEELLVKTDKVRGKVGQPSTLIRLNPDGAGSIGVKIGRRSLDILFMDLAGGISCRTRQSYRYPEPDSIFREIERGLGFVCENLPDAQRPRLVGIGVCAPSELHRWAEELGAPADKLAEWRDVDFGTRIGGMTDLPVAVMNDVAAATSAELTLGSSIVSETCLYLYVGAFVGGGIAMSHQLVSNARGNACAIGSLPLTGVRDVITGRQPEQLIRRASLIFLERELEAAGFSPDVLDDLPGAPGGGCRDLRCVAANRRGGPCLCHRGGDQRVRFPTGGDRQFAAPGGDPGHCGRRDRGVGFVQPDRIAASDTDPGQPWGGRPDFGCGVDAVEREIRAGS